MSTRALIAIKEDNMTHIYYHHYDGNPEGLGEFLFTNIDSVKSVEENKNKRTPRVVFAPEFLDIQPPCTLASLTEQAKSIWVEYVYMLDNSVTPGEWTYVRVS